MADIYTLEEIKRLLSPILSKYHARGASIFGSYARGEATPDSDLDVIVHEGGSFDPTDVFSIAEDLYTVSGKRVDVYTDAEIDTTGDFAQHISRDRVVLL